MPRLLERQRRALLCAGAAVHTTARRRGAGQAPRGAAALLNASAQPGGFWTKPAKAQLFNPIYCCNTWRCTPCLGCPGVCRCVSSCAKPAVLGGWRQHLWDGGRKSAATASWMDKCHWVHLPCTRKHCSAMHLSSIYNITIIIFKWAFLYAGNID